MSPTQAFRIALCLMFRQFNHFSLKPRNTGTDTEAQTHRYRHRHGPAIDMATMMLTATATDLMAMLLAMLLKICSQAGSLGQTLGQARGQALSDRFSDRLSLADSLSGRLSFSRTDSLKYILILFLTDSHSLKQILRETGFLFLEHAFNNSITDIESICKTKKDYRTNRWRFYTTFWP